MSMRISANAAIVPRARDRLRTAGRWCISKTPPGRSEIKYNSASAFRSAPDCSRQRARNSLPCQSPTGRTSPAPTREDGRCSAAKCNPFRNECQATQARYDSKRINRWSKRLQWPAAGPVPHAEHLKNPLCVPDAIQGMGKNRKKKFRARMPELLAFWKV